MIDPKQLEAYRQIKAPDTLKQRVMESAEARPKTLKLNSRWKKALGGVACLAILCVAILSITRSNARAQVLYEGETLSARPVSIAPAVSAKAVPFGEKMVTPVGVPLELKLSKQTKISASAGELQVYEPESGELLFVGTDLTADQDLILRWDLSSLQDTTAELTLTDKKQKTVYAITLNQNGDAVIYQKN